jgi:hypothetical protein
LKGKLAAMGFSYIKAFINIYREIQLQKKFNARFLIPYLNELETKYKGQFVAEQRKKIEKYYGLFITSFLCSSYKKLYGKKLTDDERKRATLFGILTPVGDDLFDVDKLDIENIKTLTFHPEEYSATTFSSHIAKEIQTFLLDDVVDKQAYLNASKDVLAIQIETEKQTNSAISKKELQHITYTKGAASVVIYHHTLNENLSDQMKEVLFYVGSLFQLGNDIFDLYKDVRDNIYTLVNTCDDFILFKKYFLQRVREQNNKIMVLPYPEKNKKEFCIVMNTINARSLVALDQFIALQKRTGTSIDWRSLQRKEMIVDMEKPKNFLRWMQYAYKLPKLK